ncbi:MAG: RNA methyltransferase [Bacteroidetes bacterium]|nr:RNA methyltransferase [Bacteroidota bacterium]MBL6963844.1 RNA methyltransferase [Bacteroidota bacterium]
MKKLKTSELNRLNVDEYKLSKKLPIIILLDNIRSMHNVGSVFRSSDAFLIEKIILCGFTPRPPHRDIHKTALGATESVDWEYSADIQGTISRLKKNNYIIVGLEQADEQISLEEFIPKSNEKYVIILGNELTGIHEEIMNDLDLCLEIPQYGTKHSLNVSVAAGIMMYHLSKYLKK